MDTAVNQVLEMAAMSQLWFNEYEKENFNYEPMTTFWGDFTICDILGGKKSDIIDTYNRSRDSFKDNVKFFTELVMVLNHKCWYHNDNGNPELSRIYSDIFLKARDFGYRHFKGEDLNYMYTTLD